MPRARSTAAAGALDLMRRPRLLLQPAAHLGEVGRTRSDASRRAKDEALRGSRRVCARGAAHEGANTALSLCVGAHAHKIAPAQVLPRKLGVVSKPSRSILVPHRIFAGRPRGDTELLRWRDADKVDAANLQPLGAGLRRRKHQVVSTGPLDDSGALRPLGRGLRRRDAPSLPYRPSGRLGRAKTTEARLEPVARG